MDGFNKPSFALLPCRNGRVRTTFTQTSTQHGGFYSQHASHFFARVFGNPAGDPVLLKSRGVTLLRDNDDPHDKFGGNVTLCKELSNFKSVFNLINIWRSKHPRVTQCSWFNSDLSMVVVLIIFFVSLELASKVSHCEILPCAYSDHDFVSLSFDASAISPIGLPVWKFNNSLLEDDSFCSFIRQIIHQHVRFNNNNNNNNDNVSLV